jgi:DNA gyrase subunit A
MVHARTLHTMLFFSDRGKVYSQKVYQIPEANRSDRGTPIINVLPLDGGERITAVVDVPDFEQASYCVLATMKGKLKRLELKELSAVRPSGLIAMGLDNGDELGWACVTSGKDDVIIVTANGQSLRFPEDSVRAMGRQAAGVRGIRLKKGDRVVSMQVIETGGYLLLVTEKGYGKRTAVDEYPVKGRGTGGVTTINQSHLPKIGKVASGRIVQEDDEITVISSNGMVLRIRVKSINPTGRATRGVRIMDVVAEDSVASLARILLEDIPVIPELVPELIPELVPDNDVIDIIADENEKDAEA